MIMIIKAHLRKPAECQEDIFRPEPNIDDIVDIVPDRPEQ